MPKVGAGIDSRSVCRARCKGLSACAVRREEGRQLPGSLNIPSGLPLPVWEGGGGCTQTGCWVCHPGKEGWRSCGTHREGGREVGRWPGGGESCGMAAIACRVPAAQGLGQFL